jgi:hypothetical protein
MRPADQPKAVALIDFVCLRWIKAEATRPQGSSRVFLLFSPESGSDLIVGYIAVSACFASVLAAAWHAMTVGDDSSAEHDAMPAGLKDISSRAWLDQPRSELASTTSCSSGRLACELGRRHLGGASRAVLHRMNRSSPQCALPGIRTVTQGYMAACNRYNTGRRAPEQCPAEPGFRLLRAKEDPTMPQRGPLAMSILVRACFSASAHRDFAAERHIQAPDCLVI